MSMNLVYIFRKKNDAIVPMLESLYKRYSNNEAIHTVERKGGLNKFKAR